MVRRALVLLPLTLVPFVLLALGCVPAARPTLVTPAPTPAVIGVVESAALFEEPLLGAGSLSPDGSQIAYDDGGRLVLLGVGSGAPRTLAEGRVDSLFWSGDRLVARSAGGWFTVDPTSGQVQALAAAPTPAAPSWAPPAAGRVLASPDGKQLAFVAGGEVWVGDASSGRAVTSGLGAFGAPLFRPDGQRLAVAARGENGWLDVFEVTLVTHATERVYGTAEDDLPLGYLPDGRLAVASLFHRADVVVLGAGGVPRTVDTGSSPRFEPDALHLGYTRGGPSHLADPTSGFSPGLASLGSDGLLDGPPVVLVHDAAGAGTPVFTADGRWFLYPSREQGGDDLWLRDAMGQNPHRLSQGGHDTEAPALSADDKTIVWATSSGAAPAGASGAGSGPLLVVASFDPATGQAGAPAALAVTGYQGAMADPRFSPDGSQLLFVGAGTTPHHEAVYLVPAAGGAVRRLAEYPSDDPRGGASFSADGKSVVYAAMPSALGSGGYQLESVPLAGGAPATPVASSVSSITQPTVSTGGLVAATSWSHGATLAVLPAPR